MSLVVFPRQILVDVNGNPRVGAQAFFYQSGTDTPITTYTTPAYSTPHTNPVESVSSGFFPAVYVNPAVNSTFKLVVQDSADVTIYTEDNIPALGFTGNDVAVTLFPRTAAEIAAGVTPSNFAYAEGDQRRYSTWANFIDVLEQGVVGFWWQSANLASEINSTADFHIIPMAQGVTLTATASMTNMLRTTGRVVIDGPGSWMFDGNSNVTAACIHTDDELPILRNGTVANAQLGWATGSTTDGLSYGATGEGLIENMHALNCAKIGFAARGHDTVFAGRMIVRDCRTSGTTASGDWDGTGRGFLFHFSGFDYVRFEGGDFTGDSDGYCTNAHKCNHADIDGGRYYNLRRGATLGNSTKKSSIRGVVADACSEIGIAVDTTTGTGSIDGLSVITGCVANACGRAFRSTCSKIRVDGFAAYECTDTSGMFAFAGDGADVDIANITCLSSAGGGSFVAILATENSTVNVGQNVRTNSTSRQAFLSLSSLNSAFKFGPQPRTITGNDDLRGADYKATIFADATSGAVDLDLFDFAEVSAAGFEFDLQWINTANQISVTFQSGGSTATMNYRGTSGAIALAIPAGTPPGCMHFRCAADGKTWWVEGVPPQVLYAVTNATTDRAYDADAAAVTETNDVLATLLSDLGLR